MENIALFPEQELALDNINAAWRQHIIASVIVGMRGGKSTVMREMIRRIGSDYTIAVVANTVEQAMAEIDYDHRSVIVYYSYHTLEKVLAENSDNSPLKDCAIFFLDHEWYEGAVDIIEDAYYQVTKKIVAFSSPGPYDDTFKDCIEIEAATWDWNLEIKPEDLFWNFKNDFSKAERDFGLFFSRNMLTEQVIRERFEPQR